MSAPTPVPPPSDRKSGLVPTRRALIWVALAFVAGLLLFLLIFMGRRDDDAFFRAGQRSDAQGTGFEPLPTPDTDAAAGDALPGGEDTDQDEDSVAGSGDAAGGVLEAPPEAAPLPPPVAPPSPAAPPFSDGATTSARPLRSPQPEYPRAALRRRESGTVLLQVQVDAQGRPERVDVVQSSRSRLLDSEAIRAVERWEFTPATRGGQAVVSKVLIPIEFDPQ